MEKYKFKEEELKWIEETIMKTLKELFIDLNLEQRVNLKNNLFEQVLEEIKKLIMPLEKLAYQSYKYTLLSNYTKCAVQITIYKTLINETK